MNRIEKIKNMLESLGYTSDMNVMFTLKRFEKVDNIHSNVKGKDDEQIYEMFKMFNSRHKLRIVGQTFPSSAGEMSIKNFLDFLEEYDDKFGLEWCEIDFKELSIKPVYL